MTVKRSARDYTRFLFAGRRGGHARQAGPDHHPAAAAGVRRARPRRVVIGAMDRVEIWDPPRWQRLLRGRPRRSSPTSTRTVCPAD